MNNKNNTNIKPYSNFIKISSWIFVPAIVGFILSKILINKDIIKDTNINILLILGGSFVISVIGVVIEANKYIQDISKEKIKDDSQSKS